MKGLRGRRTASAAAGLLLASASGAHAPSAHAQMAIETGSRTARPAPAAINDSPAMKPEERARATMLAYTTCLVRRHAPGVRRALALAENTGAAQKALLDLADTDCLADGQLRMSLPLFRGGLFVALYQQDLPQARTGLGAKPLDFSGDVQADGAGAQTYLALHDFCDCVTRSDPADVRALVLTPVAAPEEAAAFASLSPHMNACLPTGERLTFTKSILDALFAEALHREALAAAKAARS